MPPILYQGKNILSNSKWPEGKGKRTWWELGFGTDPRGGAGIQRHLPGEGSGGHGRKEITTIAFLAVMFGHYQGGKKGKKVVGCWGCIIGVSRVEGKKRGGKQKRRDFL